MPLTSDKRLDLIKKAVEVQRKVQESAKRTAEETRKEEKELPEKRA